VLKQRKYDFGNDKADNDENDLSDIKSAADRAKALLAEVDRREAELAEKIARTMATAEERTKEQSPIIKKAVRQPVIRYCCGRICCG
jgi:hypothetical protein